MPDQPTTRVVTGAADDGRNPLRQLAVGVLGWILWAALITWLAARASPDALDVAAFLVGAIATAAVVLVLVAVGLLRPGVMRARPRAPVEDRIAPGYQSELTGEIELEIRDGERTYVARASRLA